MGTSVPPQLHDEASRLARIEKYGPPDPDANWIESDPRPVPHTTGLPPSHPVVQQLIGDSNPYGSLKDNIELWEEKYITEYTRDDGTKALGWEYPQERHGHPDGYTSESGKRPDWIEPGQLTDRIGEPYGRYMSPEGEPWESRALPPDSLEKSYHVYEVLKPIPVYSGRAAEWFGQPGGATQYYLGPKTTVRELLKNGYLREVTP